MENIELWMWEEKKQGHADTDVMANKRISVSAPNIAMLLGNAGCPIFADTIVQNYPYWPPRNMDGNTNGRMTICITLLNNALFYYVYEVTSWLQSYTYFFLKCLYLLLNTHTLYVYQLWELIILKAWIRQHHRCENLRNKVIAIRIIRDAIW